MSRRRKQLMIRSVELEPEGPETKIRRRKKLSKSVIEERIEVPPLIEVRIRDNGVVRDLNLDIRHKKASFLIGWYSGIPDTDLITSSEEIDRFLLTRIERLRTEIGRKNVSRHVCRARIDIMKDSLGLAKDERGRWMKTPTKITHAVKIPSKFGITTDHAILTVGSDGFTITPLTEQDGWVNVISPKVFTFTVSFKGKSAMIKFGFKW